MMFTEIRLFLVEVERSKHIGKYFGPLFLFPCLLVDCNIEDKVSYIFVPLKADKYKAGEWNIQSSGNLFLDLRVFSCMIFGHSHNYFTLWFFHFQNDNQ